MIVDYMGLPVSRKVAFSLLGMADAHLEHSPEALAVKFNQVLQSKYPEMYEQAYKTPERME